MEHCHVGQWDGKIQDYIGDIKMGLYTGTSLQQGLPQGILQPETVTWYSRCAVKPPYNYVTYTDNLISELKSSGVWQQLEALYLLNQNDYGTTPYNLIQPQFDLYIPYGVSGFLPNVGFQGNGTNVKLNTNCNLFTDTTKYTLSSASMFMWSLSQNYSSTTYDMGCQSNNPLTRAAICCHNKNTFSFYANSTYAVNMTVGAASQGGFFAWSRNNDFNNVIGYNSGGAVSFPSTAVGVPYVNQLTMFNLNVNQPYVQEGFSSIQCPLFGFGGGLTQAQLDSLYGACLAYLSACGTINNDYPIDAPTFPAYFSPNSITQVRTINGPDFRVYQNIPPPVVDNQTNQINNPPTNPGYAYYPESDSGTQVVASLQPSVTSETTIGGHHWIWQMRALASAPYNTRPNNLAPDYLAGTTTSYTLVRNDPTVSGSPMLQCRMQYSSLETANAATETLLRYTLGFPAHSDSTDPMQYGYLDVANNAGIPDSSVMFFQDAYDNRNTVFPTYLTGVLGGPYYVGIDQIILSSARLIDSNVATGVILDSEAQDGRSSSDLLQQLQLYAALCASVGLEFVAYPNAWNGSGAQNTGYSYGTVSDILLELNNTPNLKLCLVAWKGNAEQNITQSLDNQLALITKGPSGTENNPINYANILMTVGIGFPTYEHKNITFKNPGQFTPSECAIINNYMQRGMAGMVVWRDYGSAGGPLTSSYNQVLAAVLGLPTS